MNLKKLLKGTDEYYISGSYVRSGLIDINYDDIDLFVPCKSTDEVMNIINKLHVSPNDKYYIRNFYVRVKTEKIDLICYNPDCITIEDIIFSSTFEFEHIYLDNEGVYHYNTKIFNSLDEIKEQLNNRVAKIVYYNTIPKMFNQLFSVLYHIDKYKNKGYIIEGKINKKNYMKK